MAPDLTIDMSLVALTRSDIRRVVRRVGGRSPYGHQQGFLGQGVGYWAGTVGFNRLSGGGSRGLNGIALLEAVIADLQDGQKSFRVPMQRQGSRLITLHDDAAPATVVKHKHGDIGLLQTGTGGVIDKPTVNSKTVRVTIIPGTRLTVGHRLYLAAPAAGAQVITGAVPVTIPDWPTASGATVHIEDPYAVGRVPQAVDITMMRIGSWGGPWQIDWEEA